MLVSCVAYSLTLKMEATISSETSVHRKLTFLLNFVYTFQFGLTSRDMTDSLHEAEDYWVFGLCPSSGIPQNTKERNISETTSVSVFR
jgi:hypothetical protein